jgi:rhamnogalacturonyl hydrolase YesR
MLRKVLFMGLFFFLVTARLWAGDTDTLNQSSTVLNYMRRVADWQIGEFRAGRNTYAKNDWQDASLYTGMMAWAMLSKEEQYFRWLYEIGEGNSWQTGANRFLADEYCVGQLYSLMYMKYREPKMIEKFRAQADSIVTRRFDESLAFRNKIYLHEWAWCDALFMGPPALAYLSTATGDMRYLKKADSLWWKTSGYLFDQTEHLYFRDSTFFGKKEANGAKVFWSRGNGWVMGGLVRVMENMPAGYAGRRRFEDQYRLMAARIAGLQQADGSWHASLLDPAAYNNKETSGTGFYCYALAWGINHGLLSREKYLPVVKKAWEVLTGCVHPDGKLGYVQAISDRPDKVDYESTNVYGAGAFLLAGTEVYKLVGGNARTVLLPAPQHITYGKGQLVLSRLYVAAAADAPADIRFALKTLQAVIKEFVGPGGQAGDVPFRYTVERSGGELPGAGEKDGDREYYKLSIDAKGIGVRAHTSAGLYYAVQTIRQLITRQGSEAALPVVEIEDQPALAYRGVMMDFAHGGLLTVEEIKRQIDFLAKWKVNQYYFYNEASIAFRGYESLNYGAAYTQEQIKGIIAYARERHVDVVPFVAFYGHLHDLLKREKYASLAIGKYGEELDPGNPQVRVVLQDWIKQYVQLFSSPFVHVGFDETWETNRISQEVDSSIHPEQLWLQHLDFVQKEWNKYGKTVLAWTDMNSYYPDVMSKFPPAVIPVIWEYSPDTSAINHYLDPVLKEKREFFIQNAVSGWGHIYPAADYTYDNIDLTLQAGMAHQTLGFITSVWTDAVEPFVRPSWMFMAYGCIGAWQGKAPDKHSFTADYSGMVFPGISSEMGEALNGLAATIDDLSRCLGRNTSNLPGGTIVESWSNPFSSYYLANTRARIDDFRKVRKECEEVEHRLVPALEKAVRKDSVFINSLLVAARLLHYTASRFIFARVICDRWNEAMLEKKKNDFVYYDIAYICHGLIQDVMDEGGELKDAYAGAWLSENMRYRLNTMLGRFDVEYGLWQKLLLKVLDYRITHERSHVADQRFEELFKPDL